MKSVAIQMLEIVAEGLKGLRKQVVFVGGATVSLYVDDPAVSTPRPTDDVDCTIEITSRTEYYQFENEIRSLGFKNQVASGPMCRWTFSGISVDIIPSESGILGFNNSWYRDGIANSQKLPLPSGTEISLFTLPYFIASKFEAYGDRGNNDPRTSSDFEDIVFVLDGCREANEKLSSAPPDVRNFLAAEYKRLAKESSFKEGIASNLPADQTRAARIARIQRIFEGL
jgi:predicted nucleotidyltransferase